MAALVIEDRGCAGLFETMRWCVRTIKFFDGGVICAEPRWKRCQMKLPVLDEVTRNLDFEAWG